MEMLQWNKMLRPEKSTINSIFSKCLDSLKHDHTDTLLCVWLSKFINIINISTLIGDRQRAALLLRDLGTVACWTITLANLEMKGSLAVIYWCKL